MLCLDHEFLLRFVHKISRFSCIFLFLFPFLLQVDDPNSLSSLTNGGEYYMTYLDCTGYPKWPEAA